MIKCLKKFKFDTKINQARNVEVNIKGKKHILFCVSENVNLDPWPEAFGYIDHPLTMVMFDENANKLWERTFGRGTVPGIWFSPFIAFDLDKDGIDEIYFVHNTDDKHPFSQFKTFMDKIDPLTGETVDSYKFPAENTLTEKMSWSFRHNLSAGYIHGEPVVVMEQGTYTNMYLQAYTTGMKKLWERKIDASDKGARASHNINVYDFNNDGIDEIYYGERIISLETGKDLYCCDEDTFTGHSDIVLPFYDKDDNYYLYTCRESGNYIGCDRVVTFDKNGNSVWRALKAEDEGPQQHVHTGWVATVKPDFRKIAFAVGLDAQRGYAEGHIFDAYTGEKTEFSLPAELCYCYPLDINGDGYHEFYCKGKIYDCEGNLLAELKGDYEIHTGTKILDIPGEQAVLINKDENTVEIWGDDETKESEVFQKRHSRGFHEHMKKLTGAGYNMLPTVTSAM